MPIQPTYPGVYVQEVSSGVKTIMGVSTSVAMFIGRAAKGKLNEPVLCNNYTDFEREFSSDTLQSEMPEQVKLFFENGGSKCYIMRIANGAANSEVTLKNEDTLPVAVLKVISKQAGIIGDYIKLCITYSSQNPEIDFNVEVFRYETKNGVKKVVESEQFLNVTMDEKSVKYAPDYISQNSNLITLKDLTTSITPALINGYSISCRPIEYVKKTGGTVPELKAEAESFRDSIKTILGSTQPKTSELNISVDGFGPVLVNLVSIDLSTISVTNINSFVNGLKTKIEDQINTPIANAGSAGISVNVEFIEGPNPLDPLKLSKLLKIASNKNGNVLIFPSQTNDLASPLMLGTSQGGLEVGAYSNRRPAPTGLTFNSSTINNIIGLAKINQSAFTTIGLPENSTPITFTNIGPDSRIYTNQVPVAVNNNNDGVREKLKIVRDAINKFAAKNPTTFFWHAEVYGCRLTLTLTQGEDNKQAIPFATGSDLTISNFFTNNVKCYSLGKSGLGSYQGAPSISGDDGTTPTTTNYEDAFEIIDKKVDIFNLLILPRDKDKDAISMSLVWGKASVFCERRRAFLIMDAPNWENVQKARDGVANLRIGLVKDYCAIFYPGLKIRINGTEKEVGPSGAIAGLMARIDSNRGVWKAPAGTEAYLTGVSGLSLRLSDAENGDLNPRAINTIRVFPNGIVNWGARTMDGDDDFQSEYKYIPVRRLALFMEESLYRGLKWVVFEPNDEPLWSQIRLNVGAFMHNLFTQGAFQGMTPKEAYFVKCDKETTTQNDINLGIVNIWVGFAPLKPAEFVILHIQQMAGKINQ